MAGRKEVTFDKSKLIAGLKEMASTPNEQNLSLMDHLKDPEVMTAIKDAQAQKYTNKQIADKLSALGLELSASTFGNYWRQIKRDMGETDGKQVGRSKTTKPRTTDKPTEAKTNTNAATSVNAAAANSESASSAKPIGNGATNPTSEAAKQTDGKPATNPAFRDRKSL